MHVHRKIIIFSRAISSQNKTHLYRGEIGWQQRYLRLIQLAADCILYTGTWMLPVCLANQGFPTETCLKLFRLSVRSLECNFSQQINGFSIPHTTRPPAPLFHHMLQLTHPWPLWADLFKHAQQYCYVQFSLSGALQFVSEISGERWSICCVFAAQAHCRSMSYVAELSCHFSYTLCSYSYIPNTTVYW